MDDVTRPQTAFFIPVVEKKKKIKLEKLLSSRIRRKPEEEEVRSNVVIVK